MLQKKNQRIPLPLLLLALIGLGFALRTGWEMAQALKARNWPQAPGVVLESRVVRLGNADSEQPVVHYRYSVAGRTYSGRRITWTEGGGNAQWARSLVRQYPPGRQVRVYYDPSDPARAVLRPEVDSRLVIGFLLGVVFFLFSAGLAWLTVRFGRAGEDAKEPLLSPDGITQGVRGIPLSFAVFFSLLWTLMCIPIAWDAWQGRFPWWGFAVPLIGPVVVFGARSLAERQAARARAAGIEPPATLEEALERVHRGTPADSPVDFPSRRADPTTARRVIVRLSLLASAVPVGALYWAWRAGYPETGRPFELFAAVMVAALLFIQVATRRLLELYVDTPRRPYPAGQRLQVREGGIWLVIPILLITAGLWSWHWMETERLRQSPEPRSPAAGGSAAVASPPVPQPDLSGSAEPAADLRPGPSLCADRVAAALPAPDAASEDTLRDLLLCKMHRPHYQRLRRDPEFARRVLRHRHQRDLYPEEQAVRALLLARAARRTPPEGALLQVVPALPEPPRVDGRLEENVWSAALQSPLPGAPHGRRSRLLLGWHGDRLYAAVIIPAADLPPTTSVGSRASWALLLQPGLSPWLDYQYFFVYAQRDGSGYAGDGCRVASQVVYDEPPPPGGWSSQERWKAVRFNECHLFPAEGGAALDAVAQARTFEASVSLEDAAIDPHHPFTLDSWVEVDFHYLGHDQRTLAPVWVVLGPSRSFGGN
ncbi:MAG: hypothetical protein KatS3mg124_1169 [Porticoccaceae bacterium]|nr:MAG: hypothetical protein KatS3mg124_1169 [Porticoccaceae bacterium]